MVEEGMMYYDLKHPQCGAEWQEQYADFPEKVQCIECGQLIKSSFVPPITMIMTEASKAEVYHELSRGG